MIDKTNKKNILLKVIAFLIAIQGIRMLLSQIFFSLAGKSSENSDLINVLLMVIFAIIILIISYKKKINLSIFPNAQTKGQKIGYVVASIIVFILAITSLMFNGGFSFYFLIPFLLSIVVTPIFEEILFRGYVWNKLKSCYKNEFTVYIISTLLFALWHIGYVDIIWFKTTLLTGNMDMVSIMFMKVITGLCFEIILGFVRYKFKNCYSTMLLHSFMNIFGR